MSSTNKTANIGLRQWERTDAFTADGLNGEMKLIDAAFTHRPELLLLRDLTITPEEGGVERIDVDLSDINFGEFYFFIIDLGAGDSGCLYFNGNAELCPCTDNIKVYFAPLKNPNEESTFIAHDGTFLKGGSGYFQYKDIKKLSYYKNGVPYTRAMDLCIWGVK